MKTNSNIWLALSALAIGILLIIFANATALFTTMVVIIGLIIIIPSVIAFIVSVNPRRRDDGTKGHPNVSLAVLSAIGIALGVCMVCVPWFFASAIIYLLGGLLILAGLSAIVYLVNIGRDSNRKVPSWLYAIPSLTIVAGILMIVLGGPRMADHIAAIVAGVVMIVYGANEIWASITGRSRKNLAGNSDFN